MHIKELWSDEDALALRRFQDATLTGSLIDALLAIDGSAGHERSLIEANLQQWARSLGDATADADPLDQAAALTRVLADELGFVGDTADYYAVENCSLRDVLERRRGMPIMVSCVWKLVGERAGITIDGVPLPGHFIIRVGGADGVYVDPFSQGALLSVPECKRVVRELSDDGVRWDDRFLNAASAHDIVDRVLRNLSNSCAEAGNATALYRAVRFHATHRPDLPEIQIVLGRMSEHFGDTAYARALFSGVMERFEGSPEALIAAQHLEDLESSPKWAN